MLKSSFFYILYIYVRLKKKDGTMGRVTDGSVKIYGEGVDQISVPKQNRLNNPNGSHTIAGSFGAVLIPQLLAFGLSQIPTDSKAATVDTTKSPSVATNPATLEGPSPQDIANILKKYDVNAEDDINPNYSDIEIALQQKQIELTQLESQYSTELQAFETAKSNYDTAAAKKAQYDSKKAGKQQELAGVNAQIQKKSARLGAIPAEIAAIDAQIQALETGDTATTDTVKTQIRRLNEQKSKLEREQKDLRNELGLDEKENKLEGKGLYGKQAKLDKDIKSIDADITALKLDDLQRTMEAAHTENVKTVEAYRETVAEIDKDLKTLDLYFGKKSINNQKNPETESIVSLLKKYNKETDSTKRANIETEIKGAIAVYRAQHPQGGNPTVDRFIELFEQKKTSGSATTAL